MSHTHCLSEMGMRLVSPSGTEATILQPYTALNVNPNAYIYLSGKRLLRGEHGRQLDPQAL